MTHLGAGFTLPLEAVTQTFAILARKGAGKTYTGMVVTEGMVQAGLQVVALDPLGAWWGLRSSADGKKEGLPITILGGEHGDIPLEPTAGKVIADLVVESGNPFILDLSSFESNAAQDRFVADFAERLYRAKAKDKRPLHLMVDEADSFAPQRPQPGQQRMLGAFESIVRRGRIRGLGITMITQRPAVLNKNVLTQAECLIVLQMTAPQDRAAIDEWVRGNGTKEQRDELMASLASLDRGMAWVWSPSWLDAFTRVQVRTRETFDSSRTPEPGQVPVEPRRLAEVDLEALRQRIGATIEKAEANDPTRLKRKIVELQRQLNTDKPVEEKVIEVQVPIAVLPPELHDLLNQAIADHRAAGNSLHRVADMVWATLDAEAARKQNAPVPKQAPVPATSLIGSLQTVRDVRVPEDDVHLKAGARRILETLAQHHPARLTVAQVGTLAKFKTSGGTFQTYWGQLKRAQFIDMTNDGYTITQAGMDYIGHTARQPQTTEELQEMWRSSLKAGARNMLDRLIAIYPRGVDKGSLAAGVEMTATGGTFQTYLGHLRRNGLIEVEDGVVRASDTLFLGDLQRGA